MFKELIKQLVKLNLNIYKKTGEKKMEFYVNCGLLKKALSKIYNIKENNYFTIINKYENSNKINLHTYNDIYDLELKIDAQVITKGYITLDRSIIPIIKKISSNKDLHFTCEDNNIKIDYPKIAKTIEFKNEGNIIDFPEIEKSTITHFNLDFLVESFKKLNVVIPYIEAPFFKAPPACLLKIKNNVLELTGTDGFRLINIKKDIDYNCKDIEVLIPKLTMEYISKNFKSPDLIDFVYVSVTDDRVIFKNGSANYCLISKIYNATEFPKYTHIINKNNKIHIKINRKEIIKECEKLMYYFPEGECLCKLRNLENKLNIIYTCELGSLQVNSNFEFIASFMENFGINISLNFLLDGLKLFKSDFVVLEIKDNNNIIKLRSFDDLSANYYFMPYQI